MISRIETVFRSKLKVSDSKIKDSGLVTVEGFVSEAETVSPNGYRYKETFWPAILSEDYVKEMINNRESLGCVEHPEDDEHYLLTPYEKASHFVQSLELRNYGNNTKAPFARIGVINTIPGCNLKALVEAEIPVGVSTRGLGETLSDAKSKFIEEESYRYLTHDVVRNPNFSSLRMRAVSDSVVSSSLFKELTQGIQLRDSGNESFNRESLLKELNRMKDALKVIETNLYKLP